MAGSVQALVDICGAGGAGEARRAGTGEGVAGGGAGGSVATRLGGTVVNLLAVLPAIPRRALAPVRIQRQQLAGGTIHAGVGVTSVGYCDLTQRRLVPNGAATDESGA